MRPAAIIVAVLLSGCGLHTPVGMNFFVARPFTGPDGVMGYKSVRVASFAVDFIGLSYFKLDAEKGTVDIRFADNRLVHEQYAVFNRKGEFVGTLTRTILPGIYTARVVEAYGDALKNVTDAVFAGVTGTILSTVVPVSLGNGLSAIPRTFAP